MEVEDRSEYHSRRLGSKSNFRVLIVSNFFIEKNDLTRHSFVYRELKEEFANRIHSIEIYTYTAEEWRALRNSTPRSPRCSNI